MLKNGRRGGLLSKKEVEVVGERKVRPGRVPSLVVVGLFIWASAKIGRGKWASAIS